MFWNLVRSDTRGFSWGGVVSLSVSSVKIKQTSWASGYSGQCG